MSKKVYKTDFLFPSNNFLLGIGSIFNVSGNYFTFNYSASDEEADIRAIESDWGMIGQDIYQVIEANHISSLQTV